MLKLCAKVIIESETKRWEFEKITSCEIVRDSEALTATCKLILPKKTKWKGESSNPIKRGDKISVYLGYDGDLQPAFSGYVLRISLKAPVVLECEDEMFSLKNLPMDYSLIKKAIPISVLLGNFTSFPVIAPRFNITPFFRSSAVTAAQFLSNIRSHGPDCFFFRIIKNTMHLVCFNQFMPNINDVVDHYIFESPVNIISIDNLDDFIPGANDVYVRISVPASNNRKKQFVERGSKDKAIKRFIIRNQDFYDVDIANRLADFIVERESKSGLKGSFSTSGKNLVWPFDIVAIKINGEKKGKYQVKKNTIIYGNSGFRQDITLGPRVAE